MRDKPDWFEWVIVITLVVLILIAAGVLFAGSAVPNPELYDCHAPGGPYSDC